MQRCSPGEDTAGSAERRFRTAVQGPRSAASGTRLEGYVTSNEQGELLVCEKSLLETHSDGADLAGEYAAAFERGQPAGSAGVPPASGPREELFRLTRVDPTRVLLLDLETTGLHSRPLFMVGMMQYQNGDFVISQLFARNQREEGAVLAEAAKCLAGSEAVVSFNGKSFDLPYLRDRMSYHRLGRVHHCHHVDVLHHARRQWGDSLPNCRLQTLETHVCGRRRAGDIPGHLIPQRYYDFVQTGDTRLIAPVFHHNRLDLITMAELLIGLLEPAHGKGARQPGRWTEPVMA